jgi:hypothetical protein
MYSIMCHPASQLYNDCSQCKVNYEANHSNILKMHFVFTSTPQRTLKVHSLYTPMSSIVNFFSNRCVSWNMITASTSDARNIMTW